MVGGCVVGGGGFLKLSQIQTTKPHPLFVVLENEKRQPLSLLSLSLLVCGSIAVVGESPGFVLAHTFWLACFAYPTGLEAQCITWENLDRLLFFVRMGLITLCSLKVLTYFRFDPTTKDFPKSYLKLWNR